LVTEESKQDNANPNPESKNPFSYLPPYYQEEFAKIEDSNGAYKGKWNWAAFLFTWIWGFTKGMWAISLIALFLSLLFNRMHSDALNLALMLIMGVRGNYFYYQLVRYNRHIPNDI